MTKCIETNLNTRNATSSTFVGICKTYEKPFFH